ncbi:MAG TPA: sialate O-acetylesterase [Victivallales bacterium]|nr:sialate O-acetylesterase [Victivallales bacterium]HRR28330.1 sialate O-acetylesterase [Victivallales bacterium]HRU01347.1 sialate O-acetylesterase [Victivallales bacterium]
MKKKIMLACIFLLGISLFSLHADKSNKEKKIEQNEENSKKVSNNDKDITVKEDRARNVIFAGKNAEKSKAVRLFILSGQSNMAALDHKQYFIPLIEKAFPDDELIFVKDAQSGQPIRRWVKNWKPTADWQPKRTYDKPGHNDLYERLMNTVKETVKDKKIDSVSFIWMQGEADAKQGQAENYGDALRELIKQVRTDLQRDDITVVIGRISDHMKGDKNWDKVREMQVKVAEEDPLVEWIDTDEFNGTSNGLHYGAGYKQLGEAFATKLIELIKRQGK